MSQSFVRRILTDGIVAGCLAPLLVVAPIRAADRAELYSPAKTVHLEFFSRQDRLHFSVRFLNRPVIEPSPMQFSVDGVDLARGATFGSITTGGGNERYPWRGVHSVATNHFNSASISLVNGDRRFTLEARAFDDGIAFRQIIPESDQPHVPDEATSFVLPANSTVWYHNLEGHYEAEHVKKNIADVTAGEWAAPPLTFKLPGDAGFASLTEADLRNYSGMAFQADGARGFKIVLAHRQPASYPFRLRYTNDIERLSRPATVSGAITSPWRVVMIGRDLNALVNCDIVHNLCPPPDPKYFPDGLRADWLKPGRAVWRYLDGGSNTFEGALEFSRMAGQLGFQYNVIEGYWSRWSDEQIRELVAESRKAGVRLFFWRHSRSLRTPEAREEFFARLQNLGVAGAKIDFFDHEHREIVDLYLALLESAAKHHIVVNFHGSNKPTGESRTWPNELTREAVRGMESSRLQDRATHDVTLPFTRFLAGPADYTPVLFGERRRNTTWSHQLASGVIFSGPLLTFGANPRNLLTNPAVELIKTMPAFWDETIVLPGSEIGELAAFARRSGDTWFVAIMNGVSERTVRISLLFLGNGAYDSMAASDVAADPAALTMQNAIIRRGDRLNIRLASGGGYVARISPKPNL